MALKIVLNSPEHKVLQSCMLSKEALIVTNIISFSKKIPIHISGFLRTDILCMIEHYGVV